MCDYLGGNEINVCLFSDPINSFDRPIGLFQKTPKEVFFQKVFRC